MELPNVNITKNNSNNYNFGRIRSLNFSGSAITNKSGEYILNQIYMQKKMLESKKSNSKRSNRNINFYITKKENKNNNLLIPIIENNNQIENIKKNLIEPSSLPKYINHMMSKNEENNIRNTLKNHFLFKNINDNVINILINQLIYLPLAKGRIVYEEEDTGNFFFILSSGIVKSYEKKELKKIYYPWNCFGELSLLTKKKREETVICEEKCELFTLDSETFIEIQRTITESILKERFNFLNTISIFRTLDNINKYNVAQKIKIKYFKENTKIINQGDIGNNLYMIKEGLVSVRINENEIRKLKDNNYFGQNSLLIDMKRSAEILTITNTICYELSRDDLIESLGKNYIDVILFNFFLHCINKNDNLKNIFIECLIQDLFNTFSIKLYNKNEKIYDIKNEDYLKSKSKRLIILIDGSIKNEKNNKIIAIKEDIIGDIFFNEYNKEILNDLIAFPDCITLESEISKLCKILKIDLNREESLNILNNISNLKKIYLFKNLSAQTLESLSLKLREYKYDENKIIIEEGSLDDSFYLISKGRVQIIQNGKFIRNLENGSCFGENVLLSYQSNIPTKYTIKTLEKVICFILKKSDFDNIIEDKNIKNIKNYLNKIFSLQDTSINLSDLYYIKSLGKGKFGTVTLVHNQKNKYAIKAIPKKIVEKQKILSKYILNERNIMLSLDHPFIVKMVKTMKNNNFCFFLLEYINGKNLDEYLSTRLMKKNLKETQFYSGSIILILEYLQKNYIAHRDIKPSNIMIESNGYLKMIDFGISKILRDYTSTLIGTPHYIPPEILLGKGYSLSCDFWSVGICIYEIFYGCYPFGNKINEIIEIYKEILNKKIFDLTKNNNYCFINNLIKSLLKKKVNKRLCNVNLIKQNEFFKDFSFSDLIDFKITPPYIPICNEINYRFFDKKNKYEDVIINHISDENFINNDHYDFIEYDENWIDEF